MRDGGFAADAAVQACRLLTWATVGFAAVESGVQLQGRSRRGRRPGGDPRGVDASESDTLFDLHIRYVIEGVAREAASGGGKSSAPNRRRSRR
jgi:hypothetical protein